MCEYVYREGLFECQWQTVERLHRVKGKHGSYRESTAGMAQLALFLPSKQRSLQCEGFNTSKVVVRVRPK